MAGYVEEYRGNKMDENNKRIGDLKGHIYTDYDRLTPEDVIKMPLAEFEQRFGFRPDDALEKHWFAVVGKRLDDIARGAMEIGLVPTGDLSKVVME